MLHYILNVHVLVSGLAGNNDVENAEIFGVIDATEDIWAKLIAYFYETNEDAKVSDLEATVCHVLF